MSLACQTTIYGPEAASPEPTAGEYKLLAFTERWGGGVSIIEATSWIEAFFGLMQSRSRDWLRGQ